MPYSDYLKHCAYELHAKGLSPRAIFDILAVEWLSVSRQGIAKLLQRVQEQGNLERVLGSGRPSKGTPWVEGNVEA